MQHQQLILQQHLFDNHAFPGGDQDIQHGFSLFEFTKQPRQSTLP